MKTQVSDSIAISVVVPCFNEQDNIKPLFGELIDVLQSLNLPYEIIFVDDASNDLTPERIHELEQDYDIVRSVRHKKNYGQSAAFLSGFELARGEALITMDADMQNDPHDIPRMIKELEDCHMVCGIRENRRDNLLRKISSRIGNSARSFILNDGIRDAGCSFRVFRREVLVRLIGFRGLHRFIPTLCRIHGFRVKQVPVNHRPRFKGSTKYGILNRLFVGIHDLFAMRWYSKRHVPLKRYKK